MRVELTGTAFSDSGRAQLVVEWTKQEYPPDIVRNVRTALRDGTRIEMPMMPGVLWHVWTIAHEHGRNVSAMVAQLREPIVKS